MTPGQTAADVRLPYAAAIIAGSLLSLVLVALHPTLQSHGLAGAAAEMSREGPLNRMVHGSFMAAFVVLVFGFRQLAHTLAGQAPLARLGVLAYGAGAGAHCGAAVLNGFAAPDFLIRAAADPALAGAAGAVLAFSWALNQALAQTGAVTTGMGILCWSAAILRRNRLLGGYGLMAGLLPTAGLLTGHLRMDIHGLGAVVILQGSWAIAAAVAMLRGRV